MLDRISTFFKRNIAEEDSRDHDHAVHLATAALLIELARTDEGIASDELTTLRHKLPGLLDLTQAEVAALVELAEEEAVSATDLFQFTRLINDFFGAEDKQQFILLMWQVAWADGEINEHEEYLIRKVCGLLHQPHSVFIRSKIAARPAST